MISTVDAKDAASARRSPARRALSAAVLWVVVEVCVRTAVPALLLEVLYPPRVAMIPATALALAQIVPALVALLFLWAVFDRRRRADGLSLWDLGYRFSARSAVVGGVCGALLLVALALPAQVDKRVFGLRADIDRWAWLVDAGVWTAPAFLLVNAVLAPVVEEFGWRGYVQTRLATTWRSPVAVIVTALLFAGKHLIVDLSLIRTTVLITASLALGLTRLRLGTCASTMTHFVLNLIASVSALFEIPGL
ncbi:MAG: CPBP family intramembrane glutamic endopeptidase [Armatimonadota bacterium]|nr:CPBP family intramembrane glutamic endopeptidase [Armatimonadota bacterium]